MADTAVAQFVPAGPTITGTVGAQALSAGTGTINVGGAISITTNGVALTMTGTSTLFNNGTIQTTGTGRAIDSNSGIANLTVTNTGLISSNSTDAFRVNTDSTISLTNSGTIRVTNGGQAIDWAAITSKSNTLTNQATGIITAVGEDAVRPGTNGVVINAGSIAATPTGGASPTGSDGIDLRTFTGISVTNTGTISGRHGIATDGANAGPSSLTVNNNAGNISALNGSGLNVDGVSASVTANVTNAFGATIKGGVLAAATDGDGDGVDVDGVLTLNNSGDILGLGAKGGTGTGNNAEGVAAGGGSITNNATGRIIGSSLAADAPNGNAARAGNGILIDDSNGANAVAATTVTNSGLIQGKSGFGIKMVGTFGDTVTNHAGGTVRGTGTGAAIQAGDGADTVNNSGTIQHDTGGVAVALEAGNDVLNVTGGAAAIVGHVDGGSGTNTVSINAGTGNTFSFAHQISNFTSLTVVEGRFNLAGAATVLAPVVVEGGGILSGTGHVNGAVTLESGGLISAGDSPGTLHLDTSLSLEDGSRFRFELGSTPASSDLVAVGGALSFSGAGSDTVLFDIVNAGLVTGTYDLITFSSSSGLALPNLAFGTTPAGFAGNFLLDGDSVSLVVSVIPEPASVATGLGALVFFGTLLRRRRRARAV